MAEVLVEFQGDVRGGDGRSYHAHAAGRGREDGTWEGWLEFQPLDGSAPLRTPRETTQPRRQDVVYWASGLTATYLEGALGRALSPAPAVVRDVAEPIVPAAFPGPAERTAAGPAPQAILDPFAVFASSGDEVLRQQLRALSSGRLRNIVRAYSLSDASATALGLMPKPELVALILAAVQQRAG